MSKKKPPSKATSKNKTRILSGGNPHIAKGDGAGPVKAYIAAIPDWKQKPARELDALISSAVPGVKKAVKWNSPFYGIEGNGWFVSFHCFTNYIKVTFFRGQALKPVPPVGSKDPNARYYHIERDQPIDKKQVTAWLKQAAKIPGWID